MLHPPVRIGHLEQRPALPPACPPGFLLLLPRNDLGAGLASPSDEGGLEEFREFAPSCAFGSACSDRSNSTITRSCAFSATSCS
ncbi:hypothetical protein GCM10009736_25340 [Actinomadura bangladeshensis]